MGSWCFLPDDLKIAWEGLGGLGRVWGDLGAVLNIPGDLKIVLGRSREGLGRSLGCLGVFFQSLMLS